jgi:hypothetical protein
MMRFVEGDLVTLKGTKTPTMYMLVVFEVMGDDLVKVCNLDGYNEQILPMKALKHPRITFDRSR